MTWNNIAFNERVKQLIETKKKTVMCVTGGGTGIFDSLLRNGGGSEFLIEGIIPYHPETTHQLIGRVPDHYSSPETARAMAVAAYNKCLKVVGKPFDAHGLACTCKLGLTNKEERKGRTHDIHVAYHDYESTTVFSLELKHIRNRVTEESLVTKFILDVMAHCYLDIDITDIKNSLFCNLQHGETINGDSFQSHIISDIITGNADSEHVPVNFARQNDFYHSPVVFPGSFNPLHDGHRRMAEIAAEKAGKPVWLELAITNTDKPQLDFIEVRDRWNALVDAIQGSDSICGIVVTNSPLFKDKARIFPERTVFVIGADTYNRIGEGKNASVKDTQTALFEKKQSFLVFPRTEQPFYYPNPMIMLSKFISDTEYQDSGISSTKLRSAKLIPSPDH